MKEEHKTPQGLSEQKDPTKWSGTDEIISVSADEGNASQSHNHDKMP